MFSPLKENYLSVFPNIDCQKMISISGHFLTRKPTHPAGFGVTAQLARLALSSMRIRRKRHESVMSIIMEEKLLQAR